jgi:hypothetical protein
VQPGSGRPESGTEPRWPALVALVAVGLLHVTLPSALLALGSRYLLLALVIFLIVPTIIPHWAGHDRTNRAFGRLVAGVVTLFTILSLITLVYVLLPHQSESILKVVPSDRVVLPAPGAQAVEVRGGVVGDQRARVRALVLAPRRGWAAPQRPTYRSPGRCVLVPRDERWSSRWRAALLVAQLRGLSVPVL